MACLGRVVLQKSPCGFSGFLVWLFWAVWFCKKVRVDFLDFSRGLFGPCSFML